MDLKKLASKSDLHREIIKFFHENPQAVDTPRGVSTWVRGDYERVKEVLDELASAGILTAHKAPSTTGYSYTTNQRIISGVGKLLKS